jgi:hypothetical protein
MTDDDYQRLLRALAAKHLVARGILTDPHFLLHKHTDLRGDLEAVSASARLLKVIQDAPNNVDLIQILREQLSQRSPIERTKKALEDTGILAALDEAGPVVFAELRRQAIPQEDIQFLVAAGYTNEEIEILFAIAIHEARSRLVSDANVSRQLEEASEIFKSALESLEPEPNEKTASPKKRKILNGIGKVLGGCIARIGNGLMAAGTILAPNPATAAGAIASAAVAVPAILCGIGDLRGE